MKLPKAFWWAFAAVFLVSVFISTIVSFLEFGALMLVISLNGIISLRRIEKKGIQCPGRIVYFERNEDDEDSVPEPLVEFTSIQNQLISGKPYIHSSGDLNYKRSNGELTDLDVIVLYLADQPERFVILDEISYSYLSLSALGLAGLAIMVVSILGLFGYFG